VESASTLANSLSFPAVFEKEEARIA